MLKMKIEGVMLDVKSNQPIIVLKDEKNRILPISVGIFEAQAIAFAMEGVHIPRPLTHDLIKNIIEKLEAKLLKIEINELKGNTYFAKLMFKSKNGREEAVDSRPSDAIAIALRLKVPIYAEESLLLNKEISSKPISDTEVKKFKEIIENIPTDDIWKELKGKEK